MCFSETRTDFGSDMIPSGKMLNWPIRDEMIGAIITLASYHYIIKCSAVFWSQINLQTLESHTRTSLPWIVFNVSLSAVATQDCFKSQHLLNGVILVHTGVEMETGMHFYLL